MFKSVFISKAATKASLSTLCLAGLLSFPLPNGAMAAQLVTRSERCDRLQHQLQTALSGRAETRQARQAETLQKRGMKFCASRREAQGLRAYAEALKLLGIKPDMADTGGQESALPPAGKTPNGKPN
ncbi:hypothetical protein HED48_15750 [Ochrobactrum intermedium]|uniref:Uncharacterized protein n=2 Tax=Brucella/Ochrobactrum group TaxID=2826938 RepID=M5JNN9_9HYPH|nr:hypothetical protein D584_12661 [Brucella intermedia M86]NKB96141.1 hypothetical protein [Brucella intermedia]OOC64981.1 hypothetical protein AS855_12650 [Brucella intermedia M86]